MDLWRTHQIQTRATTPISHPRDTPTHQIKTP
jgi:hypothetical protein